MPSACSVAIEAARSQASFWREQAAISTKDYGIPRMIAGGFPNFLELAHGQTLMRHAEQYTHFNGWSYSVITRIANRLASQKVKMGRKASQAGPITSWAWDRPPNRKMTVLERMKAPDFVKSLDADIEIIETHALLDAVQNPNPVMTDWALLYTTVCSLEITGKSYWWFIEGDDGKLSIWPLPSDWVTPVHSDRNLFERYRIRPRGQFGVQEIVDGTEIAYFSLPDPSNPIGAISPLQTQAPAIATDEEIQSAQYRHFKNGIFPGMKITLGRLPSMTGVGEGLRPFATAEQRREIREAARAVWGGTVNNNEPFIVDSLIEDIQRITSTAEEMGFMESAEHVKGRILQVFGVNPYILGAVTGVNKAQAIVAEENFATNVITPLATMIGKVMSKHIGEPDVYFWMELPVVTDPDLRLRTVQALAPFGIFTKGWARQELLGIPLAEDGTDEEYVEQGGGFGVPGGGPPTLPGTGEKPSGAQGTPQAQVEGAGTDQERSRVAMEPADVPGSAPPGDDEAIPPVGTSFNPRRLKLDAKRFPKACEYARSRR